MYRTSSKWKRREVKEVKKTGEHLKQNTLFGGD
jgi:hypothetical protein